MERRLAITYSVSATATLGLACVAFAAVGGGIFVSAAPKLNGEGKSVEFIDEYIVLHSSTTLAPIETTAVLDAGSLPAPAPAAASGAAPRASAPVAASPDLVAAPAAQPDTLAAAAPDTVSAPAAPSPEAAAPPPEPSPSPAAATTAPQATTPLPKPTPTTTAPSSSTLPRGAKIPKDWPAGRPIPPIPPGCKEPQLEDNGVWNCDE